MHCDEVRATLLDRLDQPAADVPAAAVRHLDGCAECRALHDDLHAAQAQARVWHDVAPPPWNPDPGARYHAVPGVAGRPARLWQSLIQQWLPLAASTAALVLAFLIYRQDARLPAPVPEPIVADLGSADSPAAQALLAASRQERRQEMAALTALLKAELDRQEAETEESLKYLIAHQIQSQRALDAMRGRLLQTQGQATEPL